MNTSTRAVPADDVKIVGNIIEVRVDRIRRYERQPRTYFNEESIKRLSVDMEKDGQREPITICRLNSEKDTERPFLLVDGERRWRAKRFSGERVTIKAIVDTSIKTEADLFRRSVAANLHREDMTPVDVANAISRLSKESKMRRQDIADMFGKSTAWIDQYLSLQKLAPAVQELLDPNLPDDQRLRVTVAFQIAKVPFDELQLQLAEESISENLPATDVMRRIFEHSLRENFSVPGRARKPSDEWKYIRTSLGRYLKGIARMQKIDLEWVLLHRDDGRDKKEITYQVETLLSDIDEFRTRVQDIQRKIEEVHS